MCADNLLALSWLRGPAVHSKGAHIDFRLPSAR
jgi:hypothetical protein